MFISLDVVFHEDLMYFSSDPELQGEYHKEIQTLEYDVDIPKDVDVHIFEDGGKLDILEGAELSKYIDQELELELNVGNLDISEDGELLETVIQEVGEHLENLYQRSDEHPETEFMAPPPSGSLTP